MGAEDMERRLLGVNIPSSCGLSGLEDALERIAADGWQAAELNLAACPLIIGGALREPVAAYVREVLDKFDLRFTAHACYDLDLRGDELHRRVLLSSVDACARLGIDRLNIHYEQYSHDRRKEALLLDRAREAADRGARLGVALNVENIEVEDYRYGLDAVRALDHPNCGMTLDLGHLWLSANHFGYDYLDAVRECAPWVRHLHINDNDGVFEPMRLENKPLYDTLRMGWRMTFSRGDIHIPPLWGTAPLREAFSILKEAGYPGIWLCEYNSHLFHPLNGEIRRRVVEEIEKA